MKKIRRMLFALTLIIFICFFVVNKFVLKSNSNNRIEEITVTNVKTEKASMPNVLPRSFNLRDNYATEIKNQGSEGLCWSYATLSTIESNLKVCKGVDKVFSAHQLSNIVSGTKIPTSLNMKYGEGIKFTAETGFHNSILSSGFVPVEDNVYDGELNVEDTEYFIKNTVVFPNYENTEDYRNMMKSFIRDYGAIYIATTVADARSGNFYNSEYNMLDVHYFSHDYRQAIPYGAGFFGHAMIIIGWDDDYGPDSDGDGHPDGVWMLQNSWGDDNLTKAFPYISYNSEINYLRGIKVVEEKDWDNNYTMASSPIITITGEVEDLPKSYFDGFEVNNGDEKNRLLNTTATNGSIEVTYAKYTTKETLKHINFTAATQDSAYRVYVSADGNKDNFRLVGQVKTDLPGLYTIDVNNMELLDEKFIVKIEAVRGSLYTQINAFTLDAEAKPEEYIYMTEGTNPREYQVFYHSNNLDERLSYLYKMKDANGEYIDEGFDGMPVARFNNSLVKTIIVPKETKVGSEITIEIYKESDLNTVVSSVTKTHNVNSSLDGDGTESNPFIIKSVEDFKKIPELPNACYKLNSDINLVEIHDLDFQFYGQLDGNGHKLLNYTSKNPLFSRIRNAKIFNLIIQNFEVSSNSSTGLLSGIIANSELDNISIIGRVKGTNAGLIAGEGNGNKVNNVFLYGDITGSSIGALFGISKNTNNISNCVAISYLKGIKSSSTYYAISGLIGNSTAINNVSNCYIYANVVEYERNNNLRCSLLYNRNSSTGSCNNIIESFKGIDDSSIVDVEIISEENNVILVEEFKNINSNTMIVDKEKWEVLDNNNLPTLKGKEFLFSLDEGFLPPVKIHKYRCNEERKTIENIYPTTIEQYLENININSPYVVKIFKDDEEITNGNIATGMVTKIYLNNELIAEYVNVVPGDIYADGTINSRDAGMLVQYLVGMRDEMYGTYQYYACDFSRDGKVRLNDVELIKQYVVHIYTPSEEDYYGQND